MMVTYKVKIISGKTSLSLVTRALIVCISLLYDTCSAPDRSRLRLVSACGLLKLAQCHHYKELIATDQFLRLALTMQVYIVASMHTFKCDSL